MLKDMDSQYSSALDIDLCITQLCRKVVLFVFAKDSVMRHNTGDVFVDITMLTG